MPGKARLQFLRHHAFLQGMVRGGIHRHGNRYHHIITIYFLGNTCGSGSTWRAAARPAGKAAGAGLVRRSSRCNLQHSSLVLQANPPARQRAAGR